MKKMIITGVNGFIGRCAMEYFSKDYEITGIDLADRYCEDGAEIHYYQCNMSKDSQELANIFTGVQPDVILHCAGSANVGASIVNPMADLDGNLHSLYQLLLALQSFEKRPKIIFLIKCRCLWQSKAASDHGKRCIGTDLPIWRAQADGRGTLQLL